MNEFDLLGKIRARMGAPRDRVIVGSGDDAAVVRPGGSVAVTSVDAFVEGVHFRLVTTSLRDLGHKCLAASLSDIAAMGALPGEAYLAVGLPDHLGERETLELADGARTLAEEHGVQICGGDLTRADELFMAVTVVGYANGADRLVTRSGARPHDLVGVTGALGGSGAGLLLLDRKPAGIDVQTGARLLDRHLRPRPLLKAGRALAAAGVSAMLDVSDGIASDLERLCEQSEVGIEVRLDSLPVDEGVADVAAAVGIDPVELAAEAGEDYELLLTAPEDARGAVERAGEDSGSPVTWIGRASDGEEAALTLLDETGRPRRLAGWDHLRRDRERRDPPGRASR
ncbi:MAG: thiamine-phosphate kinase [Solirubrobacterales bacterium]